MLEIYLLRHGETKWSKSGQHTGLTDIPLTEDGEKQVENLYKTIKEIKFDAVYSSPLQRVKRTCEICHLLQDAIITKDLLEWDYGEYEGLTSKEIHLTDPAWTIFTKDPKKGETAHQIEERADRLIAELLKHKDGKIALFSSGHFLRSFTARWLGFPVSFGAYFTLSTATLSILSFEHGNQVIKTWNSVPVDKKKTA